MALMPTYTGNENAFTGGRAGSTCSLSPGRLMEVLLMTMGRLEDPTVITSSPDYPASGRRQISSQIKTISCLTCDPECLNQLEGTQKAKEWNLIKHVMIQNADQVTMPI